MKGFIEQVPFKLLTNRLLYLDRSAFDRYVFLYCDSMTFNRVQRMVNSLAVMSSRNASAEVDKALWDRLQVQVNDTGYSNSLLALCKQTKRK